MKTYNFATVMKFAKRYAELGTSVQEQVDDILLGDTDDTNPNAIKFIKDRLGGLTEELDAAIDAAGMSLISTNEENKKCAPD